MKGLVLDAMLWLVIALSAGTVPRIISGPRAADRLAGLNVLAGLVLAFLVLLASKIGRTIYLDVALVYDIFGFLGLLAIARVLKDKPVEGGDGRA
ncbi:MAG: pH regulation protein F [Spirochaetales bacterium]|nr:pH regulation protein F [Spirochaetales bacterium]